MKCHSFCFHTFLAKSATVRKQALPLFCSTVSGGASLIRFFGNVHEMKLVVSKSGKPVTKMTLNELILG